MPSIVVGWESAQVHGVGDARACFPIPELDHFDPYHQLPCLPDFLEDAEEKILTDKSVVLSPLLVNFSSAAEKGGFKGTASSSPEDVATEYKASMAPWLSTRMTMLCLKLKHTSVIDSPGVLLVPRAGNICNPKKTIRLGYTVFA